MKNERIRKTAFFMLIVMVIGLLYPIRLNVTDVSAAIKETKIGDVYLDSFPFSWEKNNYMTIELKNPKEGATYTVTTSDKSIAEYCCCREWGKYSIHLRVFVKKPTDVTFTVKEEYNGVITNIGTDTHKISEVNVPVCTAGYYQVAIMEKGSKVALNNFLDQFETPVVKVTSKNPSIVKVSKSDGKVIISAKKVGKTIIEIKRKQYDGKIYTEKIEIEVKKKSNSKRNKKARSLASKIEKYCTTEITAENADDLLRKIEKLVKRKDAFRIVYKFDTPYYYTDKTTGHLMMKDTAAIMVPSKYTYEDLKYVENECKFALQMDMSSLGVSLEVVSIDIISDDSARVKLAHPVTYGELFAMYGQKDNYRFDIHWQDEKYYTKRLRGKVKEGDSEIIVKAESPIFEKGLTYEASVFDHKTCSETELVTIY